MKTRLEIPGYLTELGFTGHGVEVGAGGGWYSAKILEGSSLSRLYSIDPWGKDLPNQRCQNGVEWYLETVKTLAPFGLRSVVLRMLSEEAVKLFDDGSLDFVYIDANHEYQAVKQDIDIWYPKVKSGGIFSGHDYCTLHWGVSKAVDEFAEKTGLTFEITELDQVWMDSEIHSWVFKKP